MNKEINVAIEMEQAVTDQTDIARLSQDVSGMHINNIANNYVAIAILNVICTYVCRFSHKRNI